MGAGGYAAAVGAFDIKRLLAWLVCLALIVAGFGFFAGLLMRYGGGEHHTVSQRPHTVTCRKGSDAMIYKVTGEIHWEDHCMDWLGHPIPQSENPRCDRPDIHIWSDDHGFEALHMDACVVTTEPASAP